MRDYDPVCSMLTRRVFTLGDCAGIDIGTAKRADSEPSMPKDVRDWFEPYSQRSTHWEDDVSGTDIHLVIWPRFVKSPACVLLVAIPTFF